MGKTKWRELLDKRAILLRKNKRGLLGETALHIASGGGSLDAVKLLLDKNASANQQDNAGETPLHYAALAGHLAVAEVLLREGADPSLESHFMETPAFVARQNPAECVGVDSSKVADLLEAEMQPKKTSRCVSCLRFGFSK